AIVKTSTLVIFILFGAAFVFGLISPVESATGSSGGFLRSGWFPHGFSGFWTALLYVTFSFGGIAVVGVTSNELKSKKDVPKAGLAMILVLVVLYILSLFFVLVMADWHEISPSESPFITALSMFHIPFIGSIFNAIVISASFSTMVGALFSITSVLVSLSGDGDAPRFFKKKTGNGVPVRALGLSSFGLAMTIVLSFLLPKSVYEYLTSAAGVMLLFTWLIILASQLKNRPSYKGDHFKIPFHPYSSCLGMILIIFAVTGAFGQEKERIGFFVAIGMSLLIYAIFRVISHFMKNNSS
ncbi:MAG TPA: amino acid permease, partial [Bacillales bacterium]|nr:amino acid permease [Bacillales bacterium]